MKHDISPESFRTSPHLLEHVRRLSKVSPLRGLWGIAVQWLVIISVVTAWFSLPESMGAIRWIMYAVVVVVIGSRQHALLIMMHDAAHGRIMKNRFWNDFFSDLFCAFPNGACTELYRRHHLKHHEHTNTEKDPDWAFMQRYEDWHWPKDQLKTFRLFAADLLGLAWYKMIFGILYWSPARRLFFYKAKLKLAPAVWFRVIAFTITMLLVISLFGLWLEFFMFWFLPFVTTHLAIVRMRTLAEHMVVESEHTLNKTREVVPTFLERLIVSPLNVNYHLTHHLFPSVPHYRLPEMHRLLMREPVFRDHAHLTVSYWGLCRGVLAEVTTKKQVCCRRNEGA
jgi:fatty acid desaturase